jgi:uncharacterized glyoxalase superfamily protein PhnB
MAKRRPGTAKRTAAPMRPRPKKTAKRKGAAAPMRKSVAAPMRGAAPMVDRRHQKRETLRLRALEPSFTVNDLERSLAFYTDVLGFTVGERWTDNGVLRGVTLKAGLCELSLSQDDWAKGRDRKKGEAVRISCRTEQDIDALAERIKAAGGRLTEEPKDRSWGARTFSVDDPDGFHLTIYREE